MSLPFLMSRRSARRRSGLRGPDGRVMGCSPLLPRLAAARGLLAVAERPPQRACRFVAARATPSHDQIRLSGSGRRERPCGEGRVAKSRWLAELLVAKRPVLVRTALEPVKEVGTDSLMKAKSDGFDQSEGAVSMPMRSQTKGSRRAFFTRGLSSGETEAGSVPWSGAYRLAYDVCSLVRKPLSRCLSIPSPLYLCLALEQQIDDRGMDPVAEVWS